MLLDGLHRLVPRNLAECIDDCNLEIIPRLYVLSKVDACQIDPVEYLSFHGFSCCGGCFGAAGIWVMMWRAQRWASSFERPG